MILSHQPRTALAWVALSLLLPLGRPPSATGAQPSSLTHAMWVYETDAIVSDPKAQSELFSFCAQRRIVDLFWQTRFTPVSAASRFGPLLIPDAQALRRFIHAATGHGLRIHALSGDPSFTLPDKHERAIFRVDAILAFNRDAEPSERFSGVHFDIEPHGLKEWKGAPLATKCQLLTHLVEVSVKMAERIRRESPDLAFGADVTWWFDKRNPDGSTAYPVTFRGVTKDATKHLLDVADNLGIMSYRNTVEGRNGIISLVSQTVPYAGQVGSRAFVGVKMADIGPSAESFFGSTESEMAAALQPLLQAYADQPGFAGIAYFMYEAYRLMPKGSESDH